MEKRESTRLKHLNDSKAFIKYLNYMVDVYKIWRIQSKWKIQNIDCFDDLIADMFSNKTLNPKVKLNYLSEVEN